MYATPLIFLQCSLINFKTPYLEKTGMNQIHLENTSCWETEIQLRCWGHPDRFWKDVLGFHSPQRWLLKYGFCISIFGIHLFWKLVKETLILLSKIKLDVRVINFDLTSQNVDAHFLTSWVVIRLISSWSYSSMLGYNNVRFYAI